MITMLDRIIVESSLRVSLVAAGVALALFVVRARTTGVRYAAWTAVLAAMLLMPVLPHVVPSISVPVAPETARAIDRVQQPFTVGDAPRPALPPLAAFESQRALNWPVIVISVCLLGLVWLSLRLFIGVAGARRLLRSGVPISMDPSPTRRLDIRAPIVASSLIVTPITVGVVSPRIVLPAAWREWPAETIQAVLSHESMHVRRRDPIVLMLARVNRAVFWFHPLAWWLERKLALTAEHACDDAAAKAIGQPKRYAEVLIDMAELVRRNGGRVAWQGVGVDGAGMLRQRIDRMLRADVFRDISRTRKVIVSIGCAAAIVLAVACRQKAEEFAFAPLKPNPETVERVARQKANGAAFRAATNMTIAQVDALEAGLKQNPDDVDALNKLGTFYREKGGQVLGWDKATPPLRAHTVWMIEHHPDADNMSEWQIWSRYDQAGHDAAKRAWLAVVAKPGVTPTVLGNAAWFFEENDKPLAEEMLLRAQAIDPGGPQPLHDGTRFVSWPWRLGQLYAAELLGATGPMQEPGPLHNPSDVHSEFANAARKKLEASKTPDMLQGAAFWMASHGRSNPELASYRRTLLERAAAIDPSSAQARRLLAGFGEQDRDRRFTDLPGSMADKFTAMMAMPDQDRMDLLSFAMGVEYENGEGINAAKPDELAGNLDRCRKYADNALAMAAKYPSDTRAGLLIFSADTALGLMALRAGDMRTAVKDMRLAIAAAAFDQEKVGRELLWSRLATYVLKYGHSEERQAVIAYLERHAQTEPGAEREYELKSVQEIRDGIMPEWYSGLTGEKLTSEP